MPENTEVSQEKGHTMSFCENTIIPHTFYTITLARHATREDRQYTIGVAPDDATGRKAIRLMAFRILSWELGQEGRQRDYRWWVLDGEIRQ